MNFFLFNILNKVPYWFGYDPTLVKPFNGMWWYRQLFHFIGGLLLSSVGEFGRLTREPNLIRNINGFFWCGFICSKEILEDETTQPRYKTFFDCIAWCGGIALGSYFLSFI